MPLDLAAARLVGVGHVHHGAAEEVVALGLDPDREAAVRDQAVDPADRRRLVVVRGRAQDAAVHLQVEALDVAAERARHQAEDVAPALGRCLRLDRRHGRREEGLGRLGLGLVLGEVDRRPRDRRVHAGRVGGRERLEHEPVRRALVGYVLGQLRLDRAALDDQRLLLVDSPVVAALVLDLVEALAQVDRERGRGARRGVVRVGAGRFGRQDALPLAAVGPQPVHRQAVEGRLGRGLGPVDVGHPDLGERLLLGQHQGLARRHLAGRERACVVGHDPLRVGDRGVVAVAEAGVRGVQRSGGRHSLGPVAEAGIRRRRRVADREVQA